jgi:serine/threonine protein kinase
MDSQNVKLTESEECSSSHQGVRKGSNCSSSQQDVKLIESEESHSFEKVVELIESGDSSSSCSVPRCALAESSYYGSAPAELWTPTQLESLTDDDGFQSGRSLKFLNPSEFKVGKEIAKGGQGCVHLAVWEPNSIPVVVKILNPGHNLKSEQLWKQLRQVMELGQWSDDQDVGLQQICKVLGVCVKRNIIWIVMERMLGDLRNFLNQDVKTAQCFKSDRTMFQIRLMWSIALGMEKLHALGLLHRDLKASNILLKKASSIDLTPKLERLFKTCDLQNEKIARYRFQKNLDVSKTTLFSPTIGDYESSVAVVGTGFWRAPEVLKALKDGVTPELTEKADVYSFAMVFYEVVTGLTPFAGHPLSDYDHVLAGNRPVLPHDLPKGVTSLIYKCWDMDPCRRPWFPEIVKILTGALLARMGYDLHRFRYSHYHPFSDFV